MRAQVSWLPHQCSLFQEQVLPASPSCSYSFLPTSHGPPDQSHIFFLCPSLSLLTLFRSSLYLLGADTEVYLLASWPGSLVWFLAWHFPSLRRQRGSEGVLVAERSCLDSKKERDMDSVSSSGSIVPCLSGSQPSCPVELPYGAFKKSQHPTCFPLLRDFIICHGKNPGICSCKS